MSVFSEPPVDNGLGEYWRIARANLTPEEYEILEMKLIYGYSQTEIARIKGKPISTLSWQYNAILKKLKKIIKKGGSYEK